MRLMYRRLTKQMLKDQGIYDIYWDSESNEWWIDRYWHKNNSKEYTHKRIKIQRAVKDHKYSGKNKGYKIVTWSVKCKPYCYPLARVIYAWFSKEKEVPEGYVVDHINNNPDDNRLDNLQLLTVEENLTKRFTDNPANWTNQYGKDK